MATTTARTTGFVRSSALIRFSRPAEPSPDQPTACVRHEDCERHDGRLELAGSRAGERLRDAHPFDRDDLVGIRAVVRLTAILREEDVQGPFEVRGQVVPDVHLEKFRRLEPGLLEQLAPRARLRALAVLCGAAGEREGDPAEAVTVLPREDDLVLDDGQDGGRGAEVQPHPLLPVPARQLDLVLGDRRPCISKTLRPDDPRCGPQTRCLVRG